MAVGVRPFTDRTGTGTGSPVLNPNNGEELMHIQPSVSIVLSNRPLESHGTLYITSRQVIWLSDEDVNKGYAVNFVDISLHAVSRDPEAFHSPCIYTQIDNGQDESDEDEEELASSPSGISKVKEMRLVPSDPSQLETLFEMFCQCAELNPEPMEDADDEQHEWIFSADQLNPQELEEVSDDHWSNSIGHSNGNHDLARDVLQLQLDDPRFEDAPEEMEDDKNGNHQ